MVGLFFTKLGGPRSAMGKNQLCLGGVSLRNKPVLQFSDLHCVSHALHSSG